ncbi:Flp family type IVb pilin [Ochrobactrum sp. MYb29]|nr:Flp family type IVb pilin [Ochrobactrum sp. MYb29]TCQ71854.1 pilus assembly protein Flp/PilA [Ochrobactrum sp. BH3]
MRTILAKFWNDESGATAIEYGLIAGLISVVIISAATALGGQITKTFESITEAMTKVAPKKE